MLERALRPAICVEYIPEDPAKSFHGARVRAKKQEHDDLRGVTACDDNQHVSPVGNPMSPPEPQVKKVQESTDSLTTVLSQVLQRLEGTENSTPRSRSRSRDREQDQRSTKGRGNRCNDRGGRSNKPVKFCEFGPCSRLGHTVADCRKTKANVPQRQVTGPRSTQPRSIWEKQFHFAYCGH